MFGQIVTYTARPGEGSGGQLKMPALITRVHSETSVNLYCFPDGAEPNFRNNVERRRPDGDDFNCWEPNADTTARKAGRPAKDASEAA